VRKIPKEDIIEKATNLLKQEGRYLTQREISKGIEIYEGVFRKNDIDTEKLANELGFFKSDLFYAESAKYLDLYKKYTIEKASVVSIPEFSDYIGIPAWKIYKFQWDLEAVYEECTSTWISEEQALILYKNMIKEAKSSTPLIKFSQETGMSFHRLYHFGWDIKSIHEECGVTGRMFDRMTSLPQANQILKSLIEKKNRYVTRKELASYLGVSSSLLSVYKLPLENINAEYRFYPRAKGYEMFVGEVFSEMFPMYSLVKQKTYSDCRASESKRSVLKFDYYCPELNLLLEVDGPGHFNPACKYYAPEVVIRDQIKNEYCQQNGIPLIRIPYEPKYFKSHVQSYLSGISSPEKDGQPAAKPDENQEGSTTSRKT
jgi:hypothetical protein